MFMVYSSDYYLYCGVELKDGVIIELFEYFFCVEMVFVQVCVVGFGDVIVLCVFDWVSYVGVYSVCYVDFFVGVWDEWIVIGCIC